MLANAPHPNTAAVAGVAAAAAAAITLASPGTAGQKPEARVTEQTKPIDVKENVPSDVLDRLDQAEATGGAQPTAPTAQPARTGPPPKLPSPEQAADRQANPDVGDPEAQ